MTDWMERGNCRNYPKDHMFLSDGDLRRPSAAGRARTHRWLAVLTLDQFCTLLREATA